MPRLLLVVVLAASISPAFAQNPPASPKQKAPAVGTQADELAALKADLQRMRTTLYQMQTNLAFVGNTTTPLYHEFELDIQMWQTMLEQMQRRVDRLEKSKGRQRSPGKQ